MTVTSWGLLYGHGHGSALVSHPGRGLLCRAFRGCGCRAGVLTFVPVSEVTGKSRLEARRRQVLGTRPAEGICICVSSPSLLGGRKGRGLVGWFWKHRRCGHSRVLCGPMSNSATGRDAGTWGHSARSPFWVSLTKTRGGDCGVHLRDTAHVPPVHSTGHAGPPARGAPQAQLGLRFVGTVSSLFSSPSPGWRRTSDKGSA